MKLINISSSAVSLGTRRRETRSNRFGTVFFIIVVGKHCPTRAFDEIGLLLPLNTDRIIFPIYNDEECEE